MKVLFVHKSTLGAFGDAAMHYYPASLSNAGHEVCVLGKQGGDGSRLQAAGVEVIEIENGSSWTAAVTRIIRQRRPHVVHAFLYTGCGLLPYGARDAQRTRFVLDIRSPLLRRGIPRLLHRAKNLLEPIGYDAIAAHGLESARTQVGSRWHLEYLPPGVDLSIVPGRTKAPHREGGDGQPLRLVYIGSVDPLRRLDLLLEAAIRASQRSAIELDIYGDGSARPALEHLVRSQGLEQRIRFMGRIDRRTLFEKLISYDFGVSYIPSGMYDAAPALKTLEYLACGLPVLATDTLGNRMFIREGVNGLLSKDDPASFAASILNVAASNPIATPPQSIRNSVADFDWSRIVETRLIPLYTALLRGA